MAAAPFWMDDTAEGAAWNFCWLGDDLLPGRSVVSAEGPTHDIDVQKSKGSDGANLEDNGFKPGSCTVELTIFTSEQWDAWLQVLPHIDPQKPGALTRPLQITHPEPNLLGIQSVTVQKISGSPPSGGKKVYRIQCIQWFPAVKPSKTDKKPKTKDQSNQSFSGIPLIMPDLTSNALAN